MTQTDPTAAELTAEEARELAEDLGLQLYRAQDALAFVEECCVIADREGRQPTTADVREWLKGARCGRQLAADARDRAADRQRASAERAALLLQAAAALDRLTEETAAADMTMPEGRWQAGLDAGVRELRRLAAAPAAAVLPASVDRSDALRDFLWRLEQSAGDAAAEKFLDDNPDLRRMAAEPRNTTPPAGGAPQPKEADGARVVAYRSALPGAWSIYCTRHTDGLGTGVTPLTSEDLPDGGVCAACGVDVLIPPQPKEA